MKNRLDLIELCKIVSDENESLSNRRAVLWSLAHIAIHPEGLPFLQHECNCHFLDVVTTIALHSPVLSLRGTAFLALSFLSSSDTIRSLLQERGWFCECYSGNPICYPLHENPTFFSDVEPDNWAFPICTHFHSNKEMDFEAKYLKPTNQPASKPQSFSCPSDLLIESMESSKEEDTVLALIRRNWKRV